MTMRTSRKGEILIIEDSPVSQYLLASVAETLGFASVLAADGEEAMERLRQESAPLALVFLDLFLPGIDGISLLGHIRTSLPELPVIVITGSDDPVDETTVQKLGAAGFFRKPIDKDALLQAVAALPLKSAL